MIFSNRPSIKSLRIICISLIGFGYFFWNNLKILSAYYSLSFLFILICFFKRIRIQVGKNYINIKVKILNFTYNSYSIKNIDKVKISNDEIRFYSLNKEVLTIDKSLGVEENKKTSLDFVIGHKGLEFGNEKNFDKIFEYIKDNVSKSMTVV